MGYVVIFLLFFSINILIFNGFLVFGMVPMGNLKAAVTAYAAYVLFKTRSSDTVKPHTRISLFWMLWFGYLTVSLLGEWAMTIVHPESWAGKALYSYNSSSIVAYILIGITLVGVLAGRFPTQRPWILWLSFSGIGMIFSFFVMLSMNYLPSNIGVMIWRYSGIFDLPMLFCILMAVHSLLRVKAHELG